MLTISLIKTATYQKQSKTMQVSLTWSSKLKERYFQKWKDEEEQKKRRRSGMSVTLRD